MNRTLRRQGRGLVLVACALALAATACGSRAYSLHPDGARRAAAALREGRSAVVPARDEAGRAVSVRLEPGDELEIQVHQPGQEPAYAWLPGAELAALPAGTASLTLYHRNPGTTMLGIGSGLLGGGLLLGTLWAIGENEGWLAIPLYGPVRAMSEADDRHDACQRDDGWFCDFEYLAAVLGFVELAMQAAGVGLIVAGAVRYDPGREVEAGDGPAGVRLQLAPFVLGDGQLGGVLSGRF